MGDMVSVGWDGHSIVVQDSWGGAQPGEPFITHAQGHLSSDACVQYKSKWVGPRSRGQKESECRVILFAQFFLLLVSRGPRILNGKI